MARRKTTTDLSASILAGSEETFDFFCEPCSSEQHLEAAGYCQQCSQYLCTTCIKYHGKLAVSAHHTVLDKSVMPKAKVPSTKAVKNIDKLTEKCGKHPDKVLEYFCKSHNEICCSVCVTLDHSSCSDKNYIPDVSSGIATSLEYRRLNEDLDWLVKEITRRQDKNKDSTKTNERYKSDALSNITVFRNQINELRDRIEEDIKRTSTDLYQENTRAIKIASEECQSLLSEVNAVAENMDKKANAGKNNQLFVQMKLSSNRKEDIEKQLNKSTKFNIKQYTFDQEEKIESIMSSLSTVCSLTVRHHITPTKARYLRQINVETDEDTGACGITGIAVLAKDRVIAIDFRNKAVKLFDTKINKLISRISVSSEPFDITVMESNKVAVLLANEAKMCVFTVSTVLLRSRTFNTPSDGVTEICYNGSNFIAACQKPASIQIIDMSGNILNTVSTNSYGQSIFIRPWYITLSRDKNVVYVADLEANTMTSMTPSGHVISVYRHDMLKFPSGVAVGKDGSVYVCSGHTDTVHQLTPNGDLTRIILGRDQGLTTGPVAIAFAEEENMLYISSGGDAPEDLTYIRLYQLE